MLRLVVCDLAGTAVKDGGEVASAFQATLAAHGLAIGPEQIAAIRGASKREALAALLGVDAGDARVSALYASFRERLIETYARSARAMPGAREMFELLRRAGVRVALNTGFDRDTAAVLLDALGWRSGVVDAVICGDEVGAGRPAPDLIVAAMERTGVDDRLAVMNVGDTRLDLLAGQAAGVRWNVGVLSGAHQRDVLSTAPHTHLVPTIADLPRVWIRA